MEKIGRNEPCPCGSGKKYKKCCLARQQESASRRRVETNVAGSVLDWLAARYPEGVREAVQNGFYQGLKTSEREALSGEANRFHELLNVNLGEWLMTDARIRIGEALNPVREVLLGPDGPDLTETGRQWLRSLGEFPLSIYEVRRVEPGTGMLLADLVLPDEPEVWVGDKVATNSFLRWDTLAARLVRRDEEWILSGALYPLERETARTCLARIARKIKKEERGSDPSRETVGDIIRKEWLKSLAEEQTSQTDSAVVAGASASSSVMSGADWVNQSLESLGGKTPLESVTSAAGRRSVTELLKCCELYEARRARADGGDQVDFGLLWDRLGLKRDQSGQA